MVVRTSIEEGGIDGVATNARVVVQFDEGIDPLALDGVVILKGDMPLPVNRELNSNRRELVLTPPVGLDPLTDYALIVDGVRDYIGNLLTNPVQRPFTPGEGPAA